MAATWRSINQPFPLLLVLVLVSSSSVAGAGVSLAATQCTFEGKKHWMQFYPCSFIFSYISLYLSETTITNNTKVRKI